MSVVRLFSDGSAKSNPEGPGGYGTILQYTDADGKIHERTMSQGFYQTTNNRMELLGCIVGFEALKRPCQVEVYSDSKYLVDAFNQHWIDNWVANDWKRGRTGPVKNIDLWERLLTALKPHEVKFFWVKGHDGHPENERCDKMATSAADSQDLMDDPGLE